MKCRLTYIDEKGLTKQRVTHDITVIVCNTCDITDIVESFCVFILFFLVWGVGVVDLSLFKLKKEKL